MHGHRNDDGIPSGCMNGSALTRRRKGLPGTRLVLGVAVLAISASATLGGLALHAGWQQRATLEAELQRTRALLDQQIAHRLDIERELTAGTAELEARLARREETIAQLEAMRATLEDELLQLRRSRDELARQNADARAVLEATAAEERARQRRLELLAADRGRLEARVAELENLLARTVRERDTARREGRDLRLRIGMLERQVAELNSSRATTDAWLRRWVGRHVEAIEGLLAKAGVDPDTLLERAGGEFAAGQGGPLEPVAEASDAPLGSSVAFNLREPIGKLRATQQLVAALPLMAPLDDYWITSRYGARKDPLTKRRAMHRGVDMGAARNARVRAPAAGVVLRAGRDGAYGLLVEIDHGMGIVTRYAHMKELLVAAGDRVAPGDPIGVVGSTGRSTGRHLHYEVRIDDRPVDPVPFLKAGRQFVELLTE